MTGGRGGYYKVAFWPSKKATSQDAAKDACKPRVFKNGRATGVSFRTLSMSVSRVCGVECPSWDVMQGL